MSLVVGLGNSGSSLALSLLFNRGNGHMAVEVIRMGIRDDILKPMNSTFKEYVNYISIRL